MSDDIPGPIPPELLDVISLGLARKVMKWMVIMLGPALVLLGWLGFSSYQGLKDALKDEYQANTDRLVAATNSATARADTLRDLTEALRLILRGQTAEISFNSQQADASLRRLETYYGQVALERANERVALQRAVAEANTTSSQLQRSFTALETTTQAKFGQLLDHALTATHRADSAVTIAEESSVQTVGARQRRQLFGTPYDVYFDGVKRDALRNFMVAHHDGDTIRAVQRLRGDERIYLPNERDPQFIISVVNVLDIPGGILRITGSSRADAATFRISRVRNARPTAVTVAQ